MADDGKTIRKELEDWIAALQEQVQKYGRQNKFFDLLISSLPGLFYLLTAIFISTNGIKMWKP